MDVNTFQNPSLCHKLQKEIFCGFHEIVPRGFLIELWKYCSVSWDKEEEKHGGWALGKGEKGEETRV